MKKNYYQILKVKEDASISEIKNAYQKLKEKYDSELHSDKKNSKKWDQIQEAYRVLSHKESRKEYDRNRNESKFESSIDGKEIVENGVLEKNHKSSKADDEDSEKAYFLPRCLAYLLDLFLITSIASLIFNFFPQSENMMKLNEQLLDLQQAYIDKTVTQEEYLAQSFDLSYDLAYQNVFYVILEVGLSIGYFVVFQYKNNGQTFGKKLMKIRVISNKKEPLSMNQYLFRSLILQALALNIIAVIGVLTLPKSFYGPFYYGLQVLQSGIVISTIIMVLYRKDGRGIHDIIAGTKVVMDDSKERVLCES